MNKDIIINVESISKQYKIGSKEPYVTLRDTISSFNPFKRTSNHSTFWALKDVSFDVKRGEVIGIIGKNGAGKSTLLKILSRITEPTSGKATIQGRIASLLEVGTGFNPELTGRENIYLNGAILGMTKKEINNKFEQIVDFSGCEAFIDTPVKRYSSGMYVRLAFAIAAHLDPEILIVDEVLAVGDAEFQKKCLGKMDEVAKQEGRTVLFVSHNMSAIKTLCSQGILLDKGRVNVMGSVDKVIEAYSLSGESNQAVYLYAEDNKKKVQITKIEIIDSNNKSTTYIDISKSFSINVYYSIKEDLDKFNFVAITLNDILSNPLLITYDIDTNLELKNKRKLGNYRASFEFPPDTFNQQIVKITVRCGIPTKHNLSTNNQDYFDMKDGITLEMANINSFTNNTFSGNRAGVFLLKVPCTINKQ